MKYLKEHKEFNESNDWQSKKINEYYATQDELDNRTDIKIPYPKWPDGYNFQITRHDRTYSYITEDIIDEKVERNKDAEGWFSQMFIEIRLNTYGKEGRGDDSRRANLGSKLFFFYNHRTGKSRIMFNYNYSGREDFYDVALEQFHQGFRRLEEELKAYSITRIEENEPKEEPKKKSFFKRMFDK
jgi:hypothetical protein